MQNLEKKANSALYTIIIITIAMIIGYVVLNKTTNLTQDVSLSKSKQKILSEIYKKGDLSISLVKRYNSNSYEKFGNNISCPDKVIVFYDKNDINNNPITYSGSFSTNLDTVKNTCTGSFSSGSLIDNFTIYFATGVSNNYFSKIRNSEGNEKNLLLKNYTIDETNISSNKLESSSSSGNINNIRDGDENTYYEINNIGKKYIKIDFSSNPLFINSNPLSIEKITLKKPKEANYYYNYKFLFEDGSEETSTKRYFTKGQTEQSIDLDLRTWETGKKIRAITINTLNNFDKLVISEIEFKVFKESSENKLVKNFVYASGSIIDEDSLSYLDEKLIWTNIGELSSEEKKVKKIIIMSDGTFGSGNLTYDDYKSNSQTGVYITSSLIDDDDIPRLNFFGNIKPSSDYYNIYWSNHKTNKIIDENQNNSGSINNIKASSSTGAILNLYLKSNDNSYDYDLKVVEFSGSLYKNKNSLLASKTYSATGLTTSTGHLFLDTDFKVSLNTGSSHLFDLKNKNYAIFIKNNNPNFSLNYNLNAKTESGSGIYINPINDSGTGTIEVLSNHIIRGHLNNYIGDNIKIIGNK